LKPKKKQWTKPSPKKVAEVYEEVLDHAKSVEKQKKSQTRDDIDNIYKQLNSK
jgi:predicted small metal-binding protein